MVKQDVFISEIKAGDTVIHNGHLRTVCRNNITRDEFMGLKLFGDSYRLGHQKITRVTFKGGK